MILESLLHRAVFSAFPEMKSRPLLYMLYGGFAAGIFEEGGRVCGFWALRRFPGQPDGLSRAVGYGIGHGGLECIGVGISAASSLSLALAANSLGREGLLSRVPRNAESQVQAELAALAGAAPPAFLLSVLERAGALAFQIFLSVLIWMAVSGIVGKIWIPAAVALHAAGDFGPALYQSGALPLWGAETAALSVAVLTGFLVYRLFKKRGIRVRLSGVRGRPGTGT